MQLTQSQAEQLIDACCLKWQGKEASAKTFRNLPFNDLQAWSDWHQEENDATRLTERTRGMLVAYALLSGGSLPFVGVQLADAWFRPDAWVMGALVKLGLFIPLHDEGRFELTPRGWSVLCELMRPK